MSNTTIRGHRRPEYMVLLYAAEGNGAAAPWSAPGYGASVGPGSRRGMTVVAGEGRAFKVVILLALDTFS